LWWEHSLVVQRQALVAHNQSYYTHLAIAAAQPGQEKAHKEFEKVMAQLLSIAHKS
jgi:hypothetical protein